MLPFLYVYAIIIVLAVLAAFMRYENKVRLFYVGALVICAFVALRDESVGGDTSDYVVSFLHPEMGYGGAREKTDPGFLVVLDVLHTVLGGNSNLFIFVSALLCLFGILYLIRKASLSPMTSLLVFTVSGTTFLYLFHYMSGIRQCMAESLYFIALYQYLGPPAVEVARLRAEEEDDDGPQEAAPAEDNEEDDRAATERRNRLFAAAVCFLLAISIHTSTLIVLPVIFLSSYMLFSRFTWASILAGTYLFGVQSFISVQDLLIEFFGLFGRDFGFANRYVLYGSANFGQITTDFGWLNPYTLPFTVIAVFCCLWADKYWIRSKYTVLFFVGVVANNLFNDNIMWGRAFIYFLLLIVIVLPNVLALRRNLLSYLFTAFITAYFVYKCVGMLLTQLIEKQGNVVCPYDSFLIPFN